MVYTSSAPLSLPGGIKNPMIRPFVSGAYAGTIPAEILQLEPEVERELVGSLLSELNEKFCVNLDPNPSLDRSIPPPPTAHNTGRMVFIGGVDANGTRYNSCKPLCCIRLIYQFLVPVYHYKKKGVQRSEMFYLI
jgi:hypothetical protein